MDEARMHHISHVKPAKTCICTKGIDHPFYQIMDHTPEGRVHIIQLILPLSLRKRQRTKELQRQG